jgi:hypothetical protein
MQKNGTMKLKTRRSFGKLEIDRLTWLSTDLHESGNAERRVRTAMISQKFDYCNLIFDSFYSCSEVSGSHALNESKFLT